MRDFGMSNTTTSPGREAGSLWRKRALAVIPLGTVLAVAGLLAQHSLTDLDIFHNQVLAIHAYTFRHQGELEVMQLGDNAITVIEPGGFSGLGSLTVLYLQGNRLPRIPTAALQDVPLLAELVMFDNPLTGIYAGDFA